MTDKKKAKEIKPIKPANGWAIRYPNSLYLWGVGGMVFETRKEAIDNRIKVTTTTWKQEYQRGYRCIPVEVTARKRKAVGK